MRPMRTLALAGSLLLPGTLPAGGLGEVVKGLAGAALIRSQAGTIDELLDGLTLRRGLADKRATRVVPGYSVGRKTYVGAYQVAGPPEQVRKVHAVFEVTGQVKGGEGRLAHLIPSVTANPLDLDRVHGVSVVAAIESSLWGDVGTFPLGGRSSDRLLRAGAAVAAAKLIGPGLDDFLRKLDNQPREVETRVVPVLTAGEKSYVGLAQVMGPGASRTDAVLQLEENLGSKFRARIMIPVETTDSLKRQPGVGVGTLIDMTLKGGTRGPGGEVVGLPIPIDEPGSGPGHHYHDHDHHHDDDDDDGRRRRWKKKKGPPPWAPAHGYRRKR